MPLIALRQEIRLDKFIKEKEDGFNQVEERIKLDAKPAHAVL